jgi:hypothetical protein
MTVKELIEKFREDVQEYQSRIGAKITEGSDNWRSLGDSKNYYSCEGYKYISNLVAIHKFYNYMSDAFYLFENVSKDYPGIASMTVEQFKVCMAVSYDKIDFSKYYPTGSYSIDECIKDLDLLEYLYKNFNGNDKNIESLMFRFEIECNRKHERIDVPEFITRHIKSEQID